MEMKLGNELYYEMEQSRYLIAKDMDSSIYIIKMANYHKIGVDIERLWATFRKNQCHLGLIYNLKCGLRNEYR